MMTSISDIKQIFVDTSAWIALIDKNERYYHDSVAFHKSLNPMVLRITSWGVVSETFTWIRYHTGHRDAIRWLSLKDELENQGFLQIAFPDSVMEARVRRILDRFHAQKLSYVDAFSLALIQSRPDIDAIFAFDHHMALASIPVLPGLLH
jgi:predicted nucleic acid-binding protein